MVLPSPLYQALVATNLTATMNARTPADQRALERTTFILLGENATIKPSEEQKPTDFLVARGATLEIFEDGASATAQLFTALAPSGQACVGHAQRRVILRTRPEDTTAAVTTERGLVLEGCPPPLNAYALLVATGAYPNGQRIDATTLAASDGPPWATSRVRAIYRFARNPEPLFVVACNSENGSENEWRIGSGRKQYGSIRVPRDFEPPLLVQLGERALLVTENVVVDVDRVERVRSFHR